MSGRDGHNGHVPRPLAPLVAREAELTELLRTLDTAGTGIASAAVLGGDAGMGKTRLLAEVTNAAQERGFRTIIGHCVDLGEAPPPYLPFSEAFTRLAAEDPDVVDALLVEHPQLSRLLRGRSDRDLDARVERGELFETVLGALATLAEAQPVAVFLEDLHWADQATRDLLGFLFTRIRTRAAGDHRQLPQRRPAPPAPAAAACWPNGAGCRPSRACSSTRWPPATCAAWSTPSIPSRWPRPT